MINLKLLQLLFERTRGRVGYKLGAKAPSLDADSAALTLIDCSGYARWLLYRASNGALRLPDGSWLQWEWCEKNWRQLRQYADVRYAAKDPSRLFIAFLPTVPRRAGHVWLVRAGETLESHYSKGVNSRPWDYPTLLKGAEAAFEAPTHA